MSRVNVLCAPPNGRNPGMASVDLAFETVARDLGVEPTYWRLWDQSEWLEPPGGSIRVAKETFFDQTTELTYRLARGNLEELLDTDALVFWGDFHHMAVYLDQTEDVLHRRMAIPCSQRTENIAADYLMLRGQPDDVLARTVTFGTTLGFNSTKDYAGSYGADFRTFIGRVHGAWFRDGYSARVAELARAPRPDSCLGSDAAFLAAGPGQYADATGLGVFIGRSPISPEAVARYGRALAAGLNGRARWIPWGTAPAMWPMWGRRRLRIAWPELETGRHMNFGDRFGHLIDVARGSGTEHETFTAGELFERIARCELILTDTYHLAVNAWRIGTPAVLLYESRTPPGWNVNSGGGIGRDKRHDLYSQLDALPLLVDIHEPQTRGQTSLLLEAAVSSQGPTVDRARAIGQRARDQVTQSLSALLAS